MTGLAGATGPYMTFGSEGQALARIDEMKRSWRLVDGAYMRTLLFSNNVHEKGTTQVTIRLGTKWLDLDPLERVCLMSTSGEDMRLATVQFVAKYALGSIPQHLLDMEHDPSCRTPEGLFAEMVKVYDTTMGMWMVVTVVGYVLDR
jgi:hypothetical protein